MEVLENYIKQVAYKDDSLKEQEKEDIIAMYNTVKNKLTPENNTRLFYYTLWKNNCFNKVLLDLYIKKLNLKVSDLIYLLIFNYNNDSIIQRLEYVLNTYREYITEIEIKDIVIRAVCDDVKNTEAIFNLFSEHKFKFNSKIETSFEGKNRFFSKNVNLFRQRSCFWNQQDRVLCRHLYKELKNNHNISINNVIHVTGSNGKGSTCAFMEHILKANGYTVNKFTSPFLIKPNDEIILNGKPINSDLYCRCANKVLEAYNKVIESEDYLKEIDEIKSTDRIGKLKISNKEYDKILIWSFTVPIVISAFCEEKADFNIFEVITGGINDFTNVFTPEETIATVITNIRYGIGSNDGCMTIFNENNDIEGSNISVAYHKSMLGKKNVPMIIANQSEDVLTEIRRVAKEEVGTTTFEYDKDWILNDIDEDNFSLKIFNKVLKFKKSKILFEKFQTLNTATAIATLIKLENDGKLKLDYDLIQKGIYETRIAGRPQRILDGKYKQLLGEDTEIIYGVVKLNKSGVESIENIIEEYPDYFNYFIYTSGNKNALNSHEMYFFNFIKEQKNNSKLIIYKKDEDIYNKIKKHLDNNNTPYLEENMLSQALLYIKNDMNKEIKNRVFILCDSMKNFDKNIYYLNL